jgi:hypothetical protein
MTRRKVENALGMDAEHLYAEENCPFLIPLLSLPRARRGQLPTSSFSTSTDLLKFKRTIPIRSLTRRIRCVGIEAWCCKMENCRNCLSKRVSFPLSGQPGLTILMLVNRFVVGEAAKAVMVLQMDWLDGVQMTDRIGWQGQDGTMLRRLGHRT